MEFYILFGILSCLIGLIVGLLPGVGPSVCMMISAPFLMTLDPLSIVIFYVNMVIASQFSGSVTSIVFGIPGENTSFVASTLGFKYSVKNFGHYALAITAFSSAIASILAIMIVFLLFDFIKDQTFFYSSKIQFFILLAVYVILFFSNNNRKFTVLQIVSAIALALIGYNEIFTTSITFGIDSLIGGLSWLPVAMAILVIPLLYQELYIKSSGTRKQITTNFSTIEILEKFRRFKGSTIRASVFGSIFGLIPGAGTVAVSSSAYFFEKKFSSCPSKLLLSAEGANNSAIISSLIPLIAFGIPINVSEAILVNILQSKNTIVFMEWFALPIVGGSEISRLSMIFISVTIASLLAMLFCWQWVKVLTFTNKLNTKKLFVFLSTFLLLLMLYQGYTSHKLLTDVLTFFILLPLGWAWRDKNVMVFILVFIMFDSSSKIFLNFFQTL